MGLSWSHVLTSASTHSGNAATVSQTTVEPLGASVIDRVRSRLQLGAEALSHGIC